MTFRRLNIDQMLVAPKREEALLRAKHPDSLTGDRVEWCRLPMEEQIRRIETQRFEERLTEEVQRRFAQGAGLDELEAFAEKHRRRWMLLQGRESLGQRF